MTATLDGVTKKKIKAEPTAEQRAAEELVRRPGSRVADVCIACCDGLTGLPDAISVVWPAAVVQPGVVHLIRASLPYASRKYGLVDDYRQLVERALAS
jgi:transposase-like protein